MITSDISLQNFESFITDEPLHFMLIEDNKNTKHLIRIFQEMALHNESMQFETFTGHPQLLELAYHKNNRPADTNPNLLTNRDLAVTTLFNRWEEAGLNIHHAKGPYGCKRFTEYLDNKGWLEADWVLFM